MKTFYASSNNNMKTITCKFYLEGKCKNGDKCTFQHTRNIKPNPMQTSSRYNESKSCSQICIWWALKEYNPGNSKYAGCKNIYCNFAHSEKVKLDNDTIEFDNIISKCENKNFFRSIMESCCEIIKNNEIRIKEIFNKAEKNIPIIPTLIPSNFYNIIEFLKYTINIAKKTELDIEINEDIEKYILIIYRRMHKCKKDYDCQLHTLLISRDVEITEHDICTYGAGCKNGTHINCFNPGTQTSKLICIDNLLTGICNCKFTDAKNAENERDILKKKLRELKNTYYTANTDDRKQIYKQINKLACQINDAFYLTHLVSENKFNSIVITKKEKTEDFPALSKQNVPVAVNSRWHNISEENKQKLFTKNITILSKDKKDIGFIDVIGTAINIVKHCPELYKQYKEQKVNITFNQWLETTDFYSDNIQTLEIIQEYNIPYAVATNYIELKIKNTGMTVPEFIHHKHSDIVIWISVNKVRELLLTTPITIDEFVKNQTKFTEFYHKGIWKAYDGNWEAYNEEKQEGWNHISVIKKNNITDMSKKSNEKDFLEEDISKYITKEDHKISKEKKKIIKNDSKAIKQNIHDLPYLAKSDLNVAKQDIDKVLEDSDSDYISDDEPLINTIKKTNLLDKIIETACEIKVNPIVEVTGNNSVKAIKVIKSLKR